jgi:hypothetical protein
MGPVLNAPIILDLGKASRKNIRQMEEGRGSLIGDIQDAMAEVTASLGDQADGKQLVPVVLVYRKKTRRRRQGGRGGGGGLFPFPFLF